MKIIFELTMPNVGSWNGKFSGEKDIFTVSMNLPKKETEDIFGNYYYNFGDGWGANVEARLPESREKVTNKFLGYDWMIDSIVKHRKIITE